MANVLYLVHRLPYPPNKGDKVRSFNLLRHLLREHRVFLGAFIDDPKDSKYIRLLRAKCAEIYIARLDPGWAKMRSLNGLITGEPLTLPYYRDASLQNWVDNICRREQIDAI
ncbi:MAG: sugar transferase, partial [Azonexus sp.]|nr:sugar transferase [Azonexus sp.]